MASSGRVRPTEQPRQTTDHEARLAPRPVHATSCVTLVSRGSPGEQTPQVSALLV